MGHAVRLCEWWLVAWDFHECVYKGKINTGITKEPTQSANCIDHQVQETQDCILCRRCHVRPNYTHNILSSLFNTTQNSFSLSCAACNCICWFLCDARPMLLLCSTFSVHHPALCVQVRMPASDTPVTHTLQRIVLNLECIMLFAYLGGARCRQLSFSPCSIPVPTENLVPWPVVGGPS